MEQTRGLDVPTSILIVGLFRLRGVVNLDITQY